MNLHYLADLAASSGGTLYMMALLLLVALAVIVERSWFLYRVMAGGVAEALIATASGLFIAMTGMIFLNGLNNRIRLLVHQLETLKQMLINRCAHVGALGDDHVDARRIALARTGS